MANERYNELKALFDKIAETNDRVWDSESINELKVNKTCYLIHFDKFINDKFSSRNRLKMNLKIFPLIQLNMLF